MGAFASILLAPGNALGLQFPWSLYPVLLLSCSGGLRRIIYAFGLGYGLCMLEAGIVTSGEVARGGFTSTWSSFANGLYACYGLRLFVFLLRRQSSEAYNTSEHGKALNAKMDTTPLPIKAAVCVGVSLTQLATFCALQPLAFAQAPPRVGWLGLWTSMGGLVLESVADEQKLAAKAQHPNAPVMTGLYSIVRHPNYLGEILFWLGIATATQIALPLSASPLKRLQGGFGPVLMIWVMFGAAKGLDKKAETKYTEHADYKAYAAKTPSLWPFV